MATARGIPSLDDRVLPTLNADGTRRWIRPRLSRGRFYNRRLVIGWALIAVFVFLPYLRIAGKPAVLLDVVHRQFTFFGLTLLATDTLYFMLFLVGVIALVFLATALFGRVWCGWACPQTVYLELVYRPLERLLEGGRNRQLVLDREGPDWRRMLKFPIFLVLSMFLAHTFLAYFVGIETLARWVRQSPVEHPAAFLVMAVTTLLMFLDFAYFREQTCLVACPYGRLQSVLFDRRTLIVGYDTRRGEPRGKLAAAAGAEGKLGDCIDCHLCVTTCPTGIDIRKGLQMECIGCTQCIDACDDVMDRVGRPRGLIRYSSQASLAGEPARILRPRVVLYPLIVIAAFGGLAIALGGRETADATLVRGIGAPFTVLQGGEISNQVRLKLVNRDDRDHDYAITLTGPEGARLVVAENPLPLRPGESATTSLFIVAPASAFGGGRLEARIRLADGAQFREELTYVLLGPAAGQIHETESHETEEEEE